MNELEKDMIIKVLEYANRPLKASEIVKYIFNHFDGYVIDKRSVNQNIWRNLKNEIVIDKEQNLYSINSDNSYKFKPAESNEHKVLTDICNVLHLFKSINDVTVLKIHNIIISNLDKEYSISEIRKVYNKNDILIFEKYHELQNLSKKEIVTSQTNSLRDNELPEKQFNTTDQFNILNKNFEDILSPLHIEALKWFSINRMTEKHYSEISGLKKFDNGEIYLVNSAKGIHKPQSQIYALSIKVMKNSPYKDCIEYKRDKRWFLAYNQEKGNSWTNNSLIRCMNDSIPVGVLHQVNDVPISIFKIMGLGIIKEIADDFFLIEEINNYDYQLLNKEKSDLKFDDSSEKNTEISISPNNVFNRFSNTEKKQILDLINANEFFSASNLFAELSFKNGNKDYKLINKWFDELDN
jgi:hypothetical protein